MKYEYKAFDRSGTETRGMVESANKSEAREQLRKQGLYATSVVEEGSQEQSTNEVKGKRVSSANRLKTMAGFTRELAILVQNGTPLADALTAVERQVRDAKFAPVIKDLRTRVEEGSGFADAMSAHPVWFDAITRSLVNAGESGGNLSEMLMRLATVTQRQLQLQKTLIGAMVYPILLIVIAITVLVLMTVVVIPRFAELFESLDVPLPPTTRALMVISNLLIGYWWLVVPLCVVPVIGGSFWVRSRSGRKALDSVLVSLPIVGRMVRSFVTARIARLLGTLLNSKVPMLDALTLTKQAAGNARYSAMIEHATAVVSQGESISRVFEESKLISPSMCEAMRNAEATGRIGPVLTDMADYMDEDNEIVVKTLTGIIEPIILVILGLIVGVIAVSLFLPLFDLTSMTQG